MRRRSASVAATISARLRASASTRSASSSLRLAPSSARAAAPSTRARPRATHGAASSMASVSTVTPRPMPGRRAWLHRSSAYQGASATADQQIATSAPPTAPTTSASRW